MPERVDSMRGSNRPGGAALYTVQRAAVRICQGNTRTALDERTTCLQNTIASSSSSNSSTDGSSSKYYRRSSLGTG